MISRKFPPPPQGHSGGHLFHQDHLDTTAQLTNSDEAMPHLFTENTKEVQQTSTGPLETPLRVDHTGEIRQTLEVAPKDLIQKRSTPFKTLN